MGGLKVRMLELFVLVVSRFTSDHRVTSLSLDFSSRLRQIVNA
jgi:hypothetical protein